MSRKLPPAYTGAPGARGSGLVRSQSFGGFINRSSSSAGSGLVLGESLRSNIRPFVQKRTPGKSGLLSGNKKNFKVKMPKFPRPQRTFMMFDVVKRGLLACIEVTEEDITAMKETEERGAGRVEVLGIERQIKAAERHRKQLEFHLSKVEELEEGYKLQFELREGVRAMGKAFQKQFSTPKKSSLTNVKYGFKECSQTMCLIEAQLENLLGTFHFQMKGLVGFARLAPGDVYEIVVKYGEQKWKTRTRIGVSSHQRWDSDFRTFKVTVGDILNIKATELRSFKHVNLGEKNCEVKDLFSSHPQLMTVSLNTNGSVKLSVAITWDPLDAVDEGFALLDAGRERVLPARRRVQSMYFLNEVSSELSATSRSSSSLRIASPEPRPPQPFSFSPYNPFLSPERSALAQSTPSLVTPGYEDRTRPKSVAVLCTIDELDSDFQNKEGPIDAYKSCDISQGSTFNLRPLDQALEESSTDPVSKKSLGCSLAEAVKTLQATLDDYRGQHHELRKLEQQLSLLIQQLELGSAGDNLEMIRHEDEDMGKSVEDALGAFDFLEKEFFSDSYHNNGYSDDDELNDGRHSPQTTFQPPVKKQEGTHSQNTSSCQFKDEGRGTGNSKTSQGLFSQDSPEIKGSSLSPGSTTKTSDSGIECLEARTKTLDSCVHSYNSKGDDRTEREESVSTGNLDIDEVLVWHLEYCQKLLGNLGSFGPLKCKEIFTLEKLHRQGEVLEQLLYLLIHFPEHITDVLSVMTQLSDDKELRRFWSRCIQEKTLCAQAQRLLVQLEKSYTDWINTKYQVNPASVFTTLLTRVLDTPTFDPHQQVTLHQLFMYMRHEADCDLLHHVQQLGAELWLRGRLQSGNREMVLHTLETLQGLLPPPSCLRALASLLLGGNVDSRNMAERYLTSLRDKVREEVVVTYVDGLEDRSSDVRAASCLALKCLGAHEAMEQLVYVSQTDASRLVKKRAKETLYSFGEDGIRAFQESQLTLHGFQGVKIRF